jgi:hypothetical protein
MNKPWAKKWAAVALVCIAPLSLSGCLILPGEFTSEMTVKRSGDFTFSYKGQIQLLGLANLLNNELIDADGGEFTASCWKEEDSGAADADKAEATGTDTKKAEKAKEKAIKTSSENDIALATMRGSTSGSAATATAEEDPELAKEEGDKPKDTDATADAATVAVEAAADAATAGDASWDMEERECTAAEIATQKEEWDEQQVEKKKQKEAQKKMFAMLLGGIDPADPATIKRFTKEVERLAAWNKVEHLGNGVFMVDYSTSGKLADDFAFPVIPRYALGEPMIHITRWDNGRLRVEAPAFKTDPELSAMALIGAGSLGGMLGAGSGMSGKKPAEPVAIKGTFTLTTDAKILANNTEEGPETAAGGMEILRWDIGPASYGAPMALLKMVM